MDNPEFGHSPEATKEEAYKILLRETKENGIIFGMLMAKGGFRDDNVREILEFVRDEVTGGIAKSALDIAVFCHNINYRKRIYSNKINDFLRNKGLSTFVDVSETDNRISDAPVAQTCAKKTINKASMDSDNFLPRLEAADELRTTLLSIKDEKQRRRFGVVLNGIASGWSDEEILDEWERIEGKRVSASRINQLYTYLIQRYPKKFPGMPGSILELRRLMVPNRQEETKKQAERMREYQRQLSDELIRLADGEQSAAIKEEILVIEYLLGGGSKKSLTEVGLTEQRKIFRVKTKIASRLGIPIDFLKKQSID